MREQNTPEANRLARQAEALWFCGRNREARAAYCKALAAGYRTPSELEQAEQRRQNWELAGYMVFTAACIAAAVALKFWALS